MKKNIYEKIVAAKNAVQEDEFLSSWVTNPEDGQELVEALIKVRNMPILDRLALLTVLESGTFTYEGFNMPATVCCCDNFNAVRKAYRKKRPHYILVYDSFGDQEYTVRCG